MTAELRNGYLQIFTLLWPLPEMAQILGGSIRFLHMSLVPNTWWEAHTERTLRVAWVPGPRSQLIYFYPQSHHGAVRKFVDLRDLLHSRVLTGEPTHQVPAMRLDFTQGLLHVEFTAWLRHTPWSKAVSMFCDTKISGFFDNLKNL